MDKLKVLVVDDSAVVRKVMTEIFEKAPGIQFLGAASDPLFAMNYMGKEWPDVIVLDVEMPRMDGITFLRKIMGERPTPIVICSTLTEKGAETTMQAMAAGAVDIVTKPKVGLKGFLQDEASSLISVVKAAGKANMGRVKRLVETQAKPVNGKSHPMPGKGTSQKFNADAMLPQRAGKAMTQTTEQIVAIGTSTGGTQALEAVLSKLPRVSPGMVIVQHMPAQFTKAFADRLNSVCEIEVLEAKDGDRVIPGRALIAPGGMHMLLKRNGAQYFVEVKDGPQVNRHKPSVDVLFRSVAQHAGKNALGIIMTGMGDDGAAGLLEMRQVGAHTLGQDEASSVVYGMPREAMKKGAVEREVSLDGIPGEILKVMH